MAVTRMELSSRWIGAGFALLALASITNLFALGTTIFHIGFRYGLEIFLYPVSALLSLTGWWFLTRYRPRDTSQNHSLRAGFLALALQFAALGLGEVFRANSVVFIDWSSAQFWLASLGYVVTMIGFLMAVSCLRARVETPEVATTSTSPFSLLIFVGFALIAVSSLVILYHYVVNQFFTAMGWRAMVEIFPQPLSSLFAAVGWWFLCHLGARDEEQRTLLLQSYWALGLASAVLAISEFLVLSGVAGLSQFTWEVWLYAAGSAVAAVGFILTARAPVALAESSDLTSTH